MEQIEFIQHEEKKKRKFPLKLFTFLVFAGLVAGIFYTSSNSINLTGNVIGTFTGSSGGDIQISTELTIPDLELNQEISSVIITTNTDKILYIGNQQFFLTEDKTSEINLENYDGKINLDDEEISLLEGESTNAIINGIPLSSRSGKKLESSFESAIPYNSLTLNNIQIKKLEYEASGKINTGEERTTLNLNGEKLKMKSFSGNLTIEEGKLKLYGIIQSLDIEGDSKVSVSS
jgi:hypothetical protein